RSSAAIWERSGWQLRTGGAPTAGGACALASPALVSSAAAIASAMMMSERKALIGEEHPKPGRVARRAMGRLDSLGFGPSGSARLLLRFDDTVDGTGVGDAVKKRMKSVGIGAGEGPGFAIVPGDQHFHVSRTQALVDRISF